MKFLKTNLLIVTLSFVFSVSAFAQNYTFKVMASSGVNKKGEAPLKVGATLVGTDNVVVGNSSYLCLTYAQGGTVQISKAGTYKVKELETKLLGSKKTVTQKYATFIIGEMTKENGNDIHKNPYKYQNVTGSVERSIKQNRVNLPKTTNTFQDEYTISWAKSETGKAYLYLLNEFSEIIKTFEKSGEDTTLQLNFKDLPESALYALVVSEKPISKAKLEKDGIKDGFGMKRLETDELAKFKSGLAKIKSNATGENDVNAKLNEAMYYEEQEMYLDALKAYEEAMKLEPNDEAYEIAYRQFKIRKNIGIQPAITTSNE